MEENLSQSETIARNSKSASFKKLNPHLFSSLCGVASPQPTEAAPTDRRLRQSHKPKLNKLESSFKLELVATLPPGTLVYEQALRFELGNGIWYKPDFAAFAGWTQKPTALTCWEVKGPKAFRGGFENLKVAARLWPDIRWVLVWREDGRWLRQEVLP